jgi:hypothetical protein
MGGRTLRLSLAGQLLHSLLENAFLMSHVNVSSAVKTLLAAQPTKQTRIDDLSEVGYELSEEQLRLAVGGLRSDSAPACTQPGACDDV